MGLTTERIIELGRIAAFKSMAYWIPLPDRLATSIPALCIAHLEDPHAPDEQLIRSAWDAISAEHLSHRAERSRGPRVVRYWTVIHEPVVDRVDDQIALGQVVRGLRDDHRRALSLMADHGTVARAAQVAGCPQWRMRRTYQSARRAASRLWFSPELAPGTPAQRLDERNRP